MRMSFHSWLLLRENFDPAAYDALFNRQLDAVLPMVRNADDRQRLFALQNGWTNYIAACLRNAGFRDQGDLEERIHDIVVKLLVSPGGLFRGYDERRHGALDLRFKRSVANAVRNIVEKERNRRRYLPSIPIDNDSVHGGMSAGELPDRPEWNHDPKLIDRFRTMLQSRLGKLAVGIFDARMAGRQTKDLVSMPELGSPGRWVVKRVVQQIKTAAHDFAERLDDPDFLWRVEKLMDLEAATVARRTATTRGRRVGAGT